MISVYFEKRRALANGLAIAGESIGQLILPLLLEVMFSEYSLRGTLLIMGAMFFNIVVCGALFRPVSFYAQRNMKKRKGFPESGFTEIIEHTSILGKEVETNSDIMAPLSPVPAESRHIDYEHRLHDGSIDTSISGSSNMATHDVNYKLMDSFSNEPLLIQENNLNIHAENEEEAPSTCTKCGRKCRCDNLRKCRCDVLSILKHYPFVYFMSASIIACGIQYSTTIFLPIHSALIHEDKFKIASLISISGAMDLIGRIGSGYVADLKLIDVVYLSSISLILAGINCIILGFANKYWWIVLHTIILGLFSGAMPTLGITSFVELVGVENLPKAFAVVLVSQQIVSAAIQPFLGWLRDINDTTTILFLVVGLLTTVPACFMLLTPKLKRHYDRSQKDEIFDTNMDVRPTIATELDI